MPVLVQDLVAGLRSLAASSSMQAIAALQRLNRGVALCPPVVDSGGGARRSPRCPEDAVRELDSRVHAVISAPLALFLPDLEERLLHQWVAFNRRELFRKTPFLFGYEWKAGGPRANFQGDIVLWDGANRFLAVEVKYLKDRETGRKGKDDPKLQKVREQASFGEIFLPSFISSRAHTAEIGHATFSSRHFLLGHEAYRASRGADGEPTPELTMPTVVLEYLRQMPMPLVKGVFLTNHFLTNGGCDFVAAFERRAAREVHAYQQRCQTSLCAPPGALAGNRTRSGSQGPSSPAATASCRMSSSTRIGSRTRPCSTMTLSPCVSPSKQRRPATRRGRSTRLDQPRGPGANWTSTPSGNSWPSCSARGCCRRLMLGRASTGTLGWLRELGSRPPRPKGRQGGWRLTAPAPIELLAPQAEAIGA